MRRRWTIVLAVLLAACSRPAVIPVKKEARPIRRIAVNPFEGVGGAEVAQELAKSLAASGWVVADRKQGVDAVLTGAVTGYKPSVLTMVFLGNTHTLANGQTITVTNPVISRMGSQVLPQGPAMGVNNPHIMTENAEVDVYARLIDVDEGRSLWGDEFSYESLQLADARKAVVTALAGAMTRALLTGKPAASPLKH